MASHQGARRRSRSKKITQCAKNTKELCCTSVLNDTNTSEFCCILATFSHVFRSVSMPLKSFKHFINDGFASCSRGTLVGGPGSIEHSNKAIEMLCKLNYRCL